MGRGQFLQQARAQRAALPFLISDLRDFVLSLSKNPGLFGGEPAARRSDWPRPFKPERSGFDIGGANRDPQGRPRVMICSVQVGSYS